MQSILLQLGTLGLFIMYVLYKEGFVKFITAKGTPETPLVTAVLREEIRAASISAMEQVFKPIMENQTRILSELAAGQHEMSIGITRLLERGHSR